MGNKEIYSIREWAPLADVLEKIPARVSKGLFPVDLSITCIDVVPEFLALGCDAGIVFWYNRNNGVVQKLKTDSSSRITCIKIVNSVEYMMAAGNESGRVSVFQIQKELLPELNLVAPCARVKPIERYMIRDLHQSAITCCEWSKNGMKLYSGDRQGVVVLTELDYQNHLSKSAEILNEAYEIVQLSAHKNHLLVSTLYRSVICQRKSACFSDWKITQIGKKDRKQLADCGGVFLKGEIGSVSSMLCGRPGLRFWLADITGQVEKTLMFKDAVMHNATWEIPVLNPKSSHRNTATNYKGSVALNFGRLHVYDGSGSLVVTNDNEANLYILNLRHLKIEAVATGFRKILDLCVCGKEIFILEGDRSLIRLAPVPEKPSKKAKIIFNPSMLPPLPFLDSTKNLFICESPIELEEGAAVISAEECFEMPQIEDISSSISIELAVESPRSEQNRRLEIFQQISGLDFDKLILHHSGVSSSVRNRRSKPKRQEYTESEGVVEIGRPAIKEPKSYPEHLEFITNNATLMDTSFCIEKSNLFHEATFKNHLPEPLSPNILKKTEKVAEELDISTMHIEPITAGEISQSQEIAIASHDEHQQTKQNWQLPLAYPRHCEQVEEAVVQTTPRKKIYLTEDDGDFSSGQTDDKICQTLRSTIFKDDDEVKSAVSVAGSRHSQPKSLKFIHSKPDEEYVSSFLLDFNRARDLKSASPLVTADSNTSNEWEFLDN